MSRKELNLFFLKLSHNRTLADKFAKAVSKMGNEAGFDVTAEDVKAYFNEQPMQRELPVDGPIFSTHAVGEEDPPKMPPAPGRGTVTSMAIGEEDRVSVTLAIGEEDKPRTPPAPGGGTVTSAALGEEDGPVAPKEEFPRRTTMAIGEEGKKPGRPGGTKEEMPKKTTKMVGEEGRKPRF